MFQIHLLDLAECEDNRIIAGNRDYCTCLFVDGHMASLFLRVLSMVLNFEFTAMLLYASLLETKDQILKCLWCLSPLVSQAESVSKVG